MTNEERVEIKGSLTRQTIYILGTIITAAFIAGVKLTSMENAIENGNKLSTQTLIRVERLENTVYFKSGN
jgi:hypothetical protein